MEDRPGNDERKEKYMNQVNANHEICEQEDPCIFTFHGLHICWDITSRCNDNCYFCFAKKNSPENSLYDNIEILKKIISLKPKKISFVGGEPLLYGNNLFKLVKYGKYLDSDIEYSITTNAILFFDTNLNLNFDLLNKVKKYFNWLTFSLDGYDEDLQQKMTRNKNHFYRIITLLDILYKSTINIKINTLISKLNIVNDNIIKLADIILKSGVKRWKLMQFLPSRGTALENKNKYYITDNQFKEIYSQAVDYVSSRVNMSKSDRYDSRGYLIISSNGKLINYNGKQYYEKIDLLKESDDSLKLAIAKFNKIFRSKRNEK